MAEDVHDGAALRLQLLVLRCQAGDERAFEDLMNEFSPKTLRYLRGVVGDGAEDVQQEVWLAVYRHLSTLANPGAFRTWLFRTTRHRALDFLRKEAREHELVDRAPVETLDVPAYDDDVDGVAVPDGLLVAMEKLAPAHRDVLTLRYGNELSYAEIALVLGCSVGTVRSRLHYAKQRLNELFNELS